MDFTQTLREVIDLSSFSNVWYWIVLAVAWSSASHWVIGIPFDLIQRARREGGEAQQDLEDIARVNIHRLLHVARASGLWLAGLATFLLTGLAVLAFWYGVEMAQAIVFLAAPMTLVGAMSLSTARRLEREARTIDDLYRILLRHRFWTQVTGMAAIFVTALFGMYRNLEALIWL